MNPLLLIEDDSDIRDSMVDVLTDEGFAVVCASEGREALRLLREGLRPRAILLDLMMAGMDGFLFRAEQRSVPELADIPVILVSADRGVGEKARELGASAFLRKPMRIEDLIEVLARFK